MTPPQIFADELGNLRLEGRNAFGAFSYVFAPDRIDLAEKIQKKLLKTYK